MLRRLLEAALLATSAVLLLLSLSYLHLQLPAGRRAARGLIEILVHDAIAGGLTIGAIDSLAADRLVVRDVVLTDTQGRAVVQVRRAQGRIDYGALLERRIRVVDLAVRRPRVLLIEDAGGVPTLVQAIGPRVQRTTIGPPAFVLELERAYIRDARVEGTVGDTPVDLRQVDGRASLIVDGNEPRLAIAWARMQVVQPLLRGAATADLRLRGTVVIPSRVDARGLVRWPGGTANVRFGLQNRELTIGVRLPDGTTVDALRRLVPGYPLETGVSGYVVATGTAERLRIATDLSAAGARLQANGTIALATAGLGYDLDLALSGNPAQLLPALPLALQTGARGRLRGQGVVPETMDARFDGVLEPSTVDGYPIPGGAVHARFAQGRLALESFEPVGPGLRGLVHGQVDLDGRVDGVARLEADRMRLVHGLEAVGGSGRFDATVRGGAGEPLRLRGRGKLRGLVLGPFAARTLDTTYDVRLAAAPHPTRPGLRLEATASATDAVFAGVPLGAVHVTGRGDSSAIQATATSVRGNRRVALRALVQPRPEEAGADLVIPEVEIGFAGRTFRGQVQSLQVRPARTLVRGLSLQRGDGARIEVSGTVEPRGAIALEANATGVDVAELFELWSDERPAVEGHGDVHLVLSGATTRPRIELDARIADGRWRSLRGLGISVASSYADRKLSVDLEVSRQDTPGAAPRAVLQLAGDIPLDLYAPGGPTLDVAGERDLEIQALDLDVAELLALLPAEPGQAPIDLTGKLSGSLELTGSWARPSGTLNATLVRARTQGIDDLGLAVSGSYHPDGVRLDATLSRAGRRIVAVQGSAGLVVEESRHKLLPTLAEIARAPLDLALAFGPFDQSALPPGWNVDPPVGASVQGTGTLRGSLAHPDVACELALAGLSYPPLPWAGVVDAAVTVRYADGRLEVTPARFTRDGQPLGEVTGWASLDVSASPPTVTAIDAQVHVPDFPLADVEGLGLPITGRLALEGRVRGEPGTLSASAEAQLRELVIAGVPYASATANASLAGGTLEARTSLRQADGGTLEARTRLPAAWTLADGFQFVPQPASSLTGQLDAVHFAFDGLGAVLPGVAVLTGKTDTHLTLTGTRERPSLRGSLAVTDGSFELAEVGQRYERVSLSMVLGAGRLVLTDLRATDRYGTARASGNTMLVGLQPTRFELELQGRRFPVVIEGLTLADASGRVQIRGDASPTGIQATISPSGLTLVLPNRSVRELQTLDDHPDVNVEGTGVLAAPRLAARTDRPFVINALIDMGTPVWITRNDLALSFDGHVATRLPWGGKIAMQGTATLRRGYITAYSNRFDIQSGTVTFTGEAGFNPLLDVEASYDNPQAVVNLHATGRFERPHIAFSAAGLDQSEVLALLILGRTQVFGAEDNRALTQQAEQQTQSLLTGLGVSFLQQRARQAIPEWFPNVVIEQGSTGLDTTRVRAGSQVTRDLYLEYAGNPAAVGEQNLNEVRGEWRVSRRWSVDTFLGDRGAGGLDVLWSYTY